MPSEPSLLERDAELRELGTAFEAAAEGSGRLIVVEAPAGAGKSALLGAGLQLPETAGLRVLRARGSELERDFAFGIIRQLFEVVLTAADAAERARLLAGAAGPAERAILPQPEAAASTDAAGFATLHAILWLTTNAAEGAPLVLVVDDAHWADASSLRALNYLAGRISGTPAALLVSMRPDEPGAPEALLDELRANPAALRLTPGALSANAVARLVRERLPSAGDQVCGACHGATAGNPLLLHELLRSIAATGALGEEDPVAAIRDAAVRSLGERVLRRSAGVAPEAPALALAMAVLGEEGELELAAGLAGIGLSEAGRVAHRLRRIEVLSTEDPFSFVHPLVRRSLYDSVPASERAALHTRAAEVLRDVGAPAETLAAHLSTLPPGSSTFAATTLVAAAEGALAQAAPDEAIRWFRRALDEGAPEPPRATIVAKLGTTLAMLRDPEAIPHLEEALELEGDAGPRGRIAAALAEAHLLAGRWDLALDAVAAGRGAVGTSDPELDAKLAATGAFVMAYTPDMVERLDRERDELAGLTQGGGWGPRALAAVLAAVAAHRGDGPALVRSLTERALEGGLLLSERTSTSWAGAHVMIALVEIDDYERALQASNDMSTAARRDGSLNGLLTAVDHQGWIHARAGDLAAAEADLRTGMELAMATVSPTAAASQAFYCQDALLERPGLADVVAEIEAMELSPGLAATWIGAALLAARGRLRLARRDHGSAIADLRTSHNTHAALRMGPAVSPSRSGLALALPASDREEAMALVEEELDLARTCGLARPQGVALRAAGVLEGGQAGIEQLRESVSLLEGSGARLEHARSTVELGAALRRAQRRTEARAELAAGMELADRCGAQRLVSRAREELGAAGGRPRRVATTGLAALTASEQRVTRLAAAGATNPEIAQEIFVSLKTVETHLSHTYAKLGLAGRGAREQLVQVLEEDRQSAA